MWIPTHYACLVVFILLLESAALFAYTLIGLLKSNPLPWVMPPPQPNYALCQAASQNQQLIRGGPQNAAQQQGQYQAGMAVVTSTSVVYQTLTAPSASPNDGIALGSDTRIVTDNNGSISTVTAPTPTPTSTSSRSSSSGASATSSTTQSGGTSSSDRSSTATTTASTSQNGATSGATSISQRDSTDSRSTTDTASMQYITSVHFLTSTKPPPDGGKPGSTSTTLIIVQPSTTAK